MDVLLCTLEERKKLILSKFTYFFLEGRKIYIVKRIYLCNVNFLKLIYSVILIIYSIKTLFFELAKM